MSSKNKYKKILERKKVRLADSPGHVPALVNYQQAMEMVRSNRRAGKYKLGNYYLEQIAEQVETVPEPTVYLLEVYLDQMRLQEAQLTADFLRDKFPTDSPALRARARFHQAKGDFQEAEDVLLKAIQIYPNNFQNVEMLASICQSMGDQKRALENYERALRIQPDYYAALFGKARIVCENATDDFIAQINAAIESNKFDGIRLAALHFALAFIYADTDADKHFHQLNEANRAVAARRGFNVAARKQEAENIMRRYSRPVVDALWGLAVNDCKPIFIVSMPRSGSTLVEQIIGAHAQCQPIGESNAFPMAVAAANELGLPSFNVKTPQGLEQCRQYLLRIADNFKNNYWVAAAGSNRPVTKTIGNHYHIGSILLALPNARVINLERHPLAVIYSCYQQNFGSGNNFSFDLEWAAEYYKIYKSLMAYWKTIFPEKILTVHYENLVRDKENEVSRMLDFCDLPWDPACLQHHKSVSMVRTSSDIQVRQPVYQSSAERWKRVEPYLEPAKRLLGELLDYPA